MLLHGGVSIKYLGAPQILIRWAGSLIALYWLCEWNGSLHKPTRKYVTTHQSQNWWSVPKQKWYRYTQQ